MKVLFILLASLGSLFAKADPTDAVDPVVLKAFETNFSKAKEVDWTVTTNFYKAQFALDGQYINAFYNSDGALLAITRNITTNQLPVMLQAELKKETEKYWVSELFEITTEEGTSYFVALENADAKIVLKSSDSLDWESYSKSRKI
jgi:hypothetical protein